MILALKILLALPTYIFLYLGEKHKWARILSLVTGISWIFGMIISAISSEIPGKSDLWLNILFITIFICIYLLACFLKYEETMSDNIATASILGFVISLLATCSVSITYITIYDNNIVEESQTETKTISTITLFSTNASVEVSGSLQVDVNTKFILFVGETKTSIDGIITTEEKINYWYYDSDGNVIPDSVTKKSIKICFIDESETPHMDTVVEIRRDIETNYNTIPEKQEIREVELSRKYVFYVPKGSILENFNFDK